ncbi:MAG: hypothetical protein FRX49_06416 [Trebouxia sp. A1-2]|nr:MAG: hypothetical protein FRX49_06416 [Trebouxia sp. A1-2]
MSPPRGPKRPGLERTDPLNKTGSCGIAAILPLTSFKPILCRSKPSKVMDPPSVSTILKRVTMRLDLPLPVRPTMPTFSPAATSKETPCSIQAAKSVKLVTGPRQPELMSADWGRQADGSLEQVRGEAGGSCWSEQRL